MQGRRRWLVAAGAAVGASLVGWWQRNAIAGALLASRRNEGVELSAADPDVCSLTPVQQEGPFFFAAPRRADIREDRSGLPLTLALQIVAVDGCTPVADALAEIWHCDAAGRYSGYPEELARRPFDTLRLVGGADGQVLPTNGKTYLRGAQVSDADGRIEFQTILPGWYEPRATHIHVKVMHAEREYVTTQLYFPDELVRTIYAQHEDYVAHGLPQYAAHNDAVLGTYPDAHGLLLQPLQEGAGLRASARLAVSA